jgi:hypothetical protein
MRESAVAEVPVEVVQLQGGAARAAMALSLPSIHCLILLHMLDRQQVHVGF